MTNSSKQPAGGQCARPLPYDDILDDLFHGCAFAAYIELAREAGGPPDCEATRRLAFRYFEEELAVRQDRRRGEGNRITVAS